jgi:DNA-binding response OmpR family regulator
MVFDDEPAVLDLLKTFLSHRGYEVFCFSTPLACPDVMNKEIPCYHGKPCADILITDFKMPGMSGLELLELQRERGCSLDIRNKAVISGLVDEEEMNRIMMMGCSFFRKPFRFSELSAWIEACEERLPLSVSASTGRRETRKPVTINVTYTLPSLAMKLDGIVTNVSDSGFCLKTDRAIPECAYIRISSDQPVICKTASVRWAKKLEDDAFMIGCNCC